MADGIDKPGLWSRLRAFQLDDPSASLTFSRRLARENGWSHAFALRVVDEYKRFVYLAMTAGHEVTPSDEVDQAWHLHLTYTRSYWGELCEGVLGRPLHHGPTKGGEAEGARFEDQYTQTFASYRAAFGEEPPADIWPPAEVRFGEATRFVRVNQSRAWVVSKPWRIDGGRPLAVAASLAVVLPPLAAGAAWNPLDFKGPQFLAFYLTLSVLAVLAALVCRNVLRKPDEGHDSEPIEELLRKPLALASLRGGWQAAYQAALAGLIAEGSIKIEKQGGFFSKKYYAVAQRDLTSTDSELQHVLLTKTKGQARFDILGRHAKPVAEQWDDRLEAAGLLETNASFAAARVVPLLLIGSVWLVGFAKLWVGTGRGKPVGFLFVALLVMAFVFVFFCRKPRRTRAGDRCWFRKLREHETLKHQARQKRADLTAADTALAVGLFGVAATEAPDLAPLRHAVSSANPGSGGSGCGSTGGDGGCGGGGCGGGCGGCGG